MRTRILLGLIVFLFTWSAFVSVTFAQTKKQEIESLRGLQGVRVVVENIHPEAERDGLTRSQLQVVVELELRKAGIKVLTEEEQSSTPGSPFLYVNVTAVRRKASVIYGYSISVELCQVVVLYRDQSIMITTTTWWSGVVGTVGAPKLQDISDSVKEKVDVFINDYLTVNPK